jgi:hypothetical protein
VKEITLRLSDAQFNRVAEVAKLLGTTPEILVLVEAFTNMDSNSGSEGAYVESWPWFHQVYAEQGLASNPADPYSLEFENHLRLEVAHVSA